MDGHLSEAVDGVRSATLGLADAQRVLEEAVVAAREAGATWALIGEAVGMSRQSAHERWTARALACHAGTWQCLPKLGTSQRRAWG